MVFPFFTKKCVHSVFAFFEQFKIYRKTEQLVLSFPSILQPIFTYLLVSYINMVYLLQLTNILHLFWANIHALFSSLYFFPGAFSSAPEPHLESRLEYHNTFSCHGSLGSFWL